MKNPIIFSVLAIFCFTLIFSCSKKEPVIAFTNTTMKPWFDTHCASCHAKGTSSANKWLYDNADFNNSIKKYISDIQKEVVTKKSMPQGTALSTIELQKFIDWYSAGYPVN